VSDLTSSVISAWLLFEFVFFRTIHTIKLRKNFRLGTIPLHYEFYTRRFFRFSFTDHRTQFSTFTCGLPIRHYHDYLTITRRPSQVCHREDTITSRRAQLDFFLKVVQIFSSVYRNATIRIQYELWPRERIIKSLLTFPPRSEVSNLRNCDKCAQFGPFWNNFLFLDVIDQPVSKTRWESIAKKKKTFKAAYFGTDDTEMTSS
jgi:hypothetical protein